MKSFYLLFLIFLTTINIFAQTNENKETPVNKEVEAKGGGVSNEQMTKSNNPLANLNSFNLQNYYSPKIQGTTEVGNSLLIRGVMVSGRQIIRATMPITTIPTAEGYRSGLGDFSIFDIIKLTGDSAKSEFGVGPLIAVPTATSNSLGSGKWQIGGAAVIIHPMKGGNMIGALITYQTSIAGNENRTGTNLLVFQPVLTLNMGNGLYGRSAGATWTFDFQNNRTLIPIGIGVGKIFKAGKTLVNIFIEPELTAYSEGQGQPAYQIFLGLNFQWIKK